MASVHGPSMQGLPEDVRSEIDRHNFLDFAGVLLMLAGGFNTVEGISAISSANVVNDHRTMLSFDRTARRNVSRLPDQSSWRIAARTNVRRITRESTTGRLKLSQTMSVARAHTT